MDCPQNKQKPKTKEELLEEVRTQLFLGWLPSWLSKQVKEQKCTSALWHGYFEIGTPQALKIDRLKNHLAHAHPSASKYENS